jgi:hypothetical protein
MSIYRAYQAHNLDNRSLFVVAIGRRPLLVAGWGTVCTCLLGGCETIEGSEIAAEDKNIGSQFAALTGSRSRNPDAYLALYRQLHASNTALLIELDKIDPPAGIRRHHAGFVGGLQDLVNAIDRVVAMIEEGNVMTANREFQRAVTRSQAKQTGAMLNIRHVARSVGIEM